MQTKRSSIPEYLQDVPKEDLIDCIFETISISKADFIEVFRDIAKAAYDYSEGTFPESELEGKSVLAFILGTYEHLLDNNYEIYESEK